MLPMRLFGNPVFTVAGILSFIVGFAMLGALSFLPTYMQYVQGTSATSSGIRLLPMVLGLLVASIFAGNVVSRTGRYKIFPTWAAAAIMTPACTCCRCSTPGTGLCAVLGLHAGAGRRHRPRPCRC